MDLIQAAEKGDIDAVKEAIERGADVNVKDIVFNTALSRASQEGHTEIVKLLIERGADVNIRDFVNTTALMWASIYGHTEIAELLIKNGADVNAQENNYTTALIHASMYGHTEIAELLIKNGADVNAKNWESKSAFIYASEKKHAEIIKLLKENGADISIINNTDVDTLAVTSGKPSELIDIDNNSYQVVKIGNQLWMAENLRVTHYANGDPIPNVTSDRQWTRVGNFTNSLEGAYCYYDNDENNHSIYGCLYNWFAIIDGRSFCPPGWHIPTAEEWKILETYLGGSSVAGGKMKEVGTKHWDSPNSGANNTSGFCALPGGYRNPDGSYHSIGGIAQFWSSTEVQDKDWYYTFSCYLRCLSSDISLSPTNQSNGLSVRCIKD